MQIKSPSTLQDDCFGNRLAKFLWLLFLTAFEPQPKKVNSEKHPAHLASCFSLTVTLSKVVFAVCFTLIKKSSLGSEVQTLTLISDVGLTLSDFST